MFKSSLRISLPSPYAGAIPVVVILTAIGLVFGQVVTFTFLDWDDNFMVTANDYVRHGLTWAGLAWLPTGIIAYSWHPLTNLSWMVDATLWGGWAGGFHLSNLVYHALTALLVWRLLLRLRIRPGPALTVVLLFALHPLRVEPVAWITGRKDLMAALCIVAACWAYTEYRQRRAVGGYIAVSALVALAAMAKPLSVVLVPLFLWIDAWSTLTDGVGRAPGRPLLRVVYRQLLEKSPWFLITLLPAAMMWATHAGSDAVLTPFAGSVADRLAYPLLAVGEYLRLTVWPVGLQYLHPMWADYSPALAALSLMVILGISAVAWRLRGPAPAILFGWGWFLIALAPGAGIVRIGHHAIAERYVHLPHVGLILALVALAAWALGRLRAARFAPVIALVVTLSAGLAAHVYAATWRDSESLYRRALSVTPDHLLARKSLALLLAARGEVEQARALVEPLHQATLVRPDPESAFELAGLYARLGPTERAEDWFAYAAKLAPQVHAVWMARAQFRLAQQRYAEASDDFAVALRLRPEFKQAWVGYGYSRLYSGDPAQAEAAFERAIAIDPGYAEAFFHLGVLAELQGQFALARQRYSAALARDPWHAGASRRLERLSASQG